MTVDADLQSRLRFLVRVVQRERKHLLATDSRVFNLDQAERLGWLASADEWLATRKLRNQMIHEYIEDPAILASALQAGHERLPMLVAAGAALLAEIERRGWLAGGTRDVSA